MMRLITILLFCLLSVSSFADGPKRELRGVWVATVQNIDWPSPHNYDGAKQKSEFIDLLNSHQKTGINALFVQIRTASDALYAKSAEPWTTYLSGKQGQAPSPYYDPLEFMIDQTHARGMEFHAWLNLNRASMSSRSLLSSEHVARKHPEWLLSYNGQLLFDFGIPAVRHYIAGLVRNIIVNYDVDGIHFDDYFYPYPDPKSTLKDEDTYLKYRHAGESKADWRRRNTSALIQEISETIRKTNPKIKFGISPFGIWRHKTSDPVNGMPTVRGLQSYDDLYADTDHWLKQGWLDYIAPQLYWDTSHRVAPFKPLADWWNAHSYGKPVYFGMASYHLGDVWTNKEMKKQVEISRSMSNGQGLIFYSSTSLTKNTKAFRDTLRRNYFAHTALLPTSPWLDSIAPHAPAQVFLANKKLKWQAGEESDDGDPVAYYVVYRIPKQDKKHLEDPSNIVYKGKATELILEQDDLKPGYGFTVTAFDRLHNESRPSAVQWVKPVSSD